MTAPGRPVWLELNAQRVTQAVSFYRELFHWGGAALHVPPWGSIPLIANGNRIFANQFMAMGAFAPPHWKVWFSCDLERAVGRITALGGNAGEGVVTIGDFSRQVNAVDPKGVPFGMIEVLAHAVPDTDAPGDPCATEYFSPEARSVAPFYADVLGLTARETPRGATLLDGETPRAFLNEVGFDLRPCWIPYFRSVGVGGDTERARRAGAVAQQHKEAVPGLGELSVFADPANAYFGLLDPSGA